MKVGELIRILQTHDPVLDVAVHDAQEESVSMASGVFTETKGEEDEHVYVKGDHPFDYCRDKVTDTILVITGG